MSKGFRTRTWYIMINDVTIYWFRGQCGTFRKWLPLILGNSGIVYDDKINTFANSFNRPSRRPRGLHRDIKSVWFRFRRFESRLRAYRTLQCLAQRFPWIAVVLLIVLIKRQILIYLNICETDKEDFCCLRR